MTCDMSVDYLGYFGCYQQLNWPPRYTCSWNIVESDINPIFLTLSLMISGINLTVAGQQKDHLCGLLMDRDHFFFFCFISNRDEKGPISEILHICKVEWNLCDLNLLGTSFCVWNKQVLKFPRLGHYFSSVYRGLHFVQGSVLCIFRSPEPKGHI